MDDRIKKNTMNLDNNLMKQFGDNLNKNVNLSNYSWFNLGGNAEYFFKAKDKNQLKFFLDEVKKENIDTLILGAGSNTLFRDRGVKGAVIKLGKDFNFIKIIEKNVLEVGAATLDRKVADYAKNNNLKGFEFLSCIPGSIGGAIIMNSGCYDHDISNILLSVTVLNKTNLEEIEVKKEEIDFYYRGTNIPNDFIILSAKFEGTKGLKDDIEKTQIDFVERKKLSQPSQIKTCGSTFKNISKDKKAWRLIKDSGCEGFTEGDATISKKHCNFFVNNGNAKSSDIENLINRVQKRVFEKTGVSLELEIKIIGEKK